MNFSLGSLRELHLELTEQCNARCPMCGRFDSEGETNRHLKKSEISLSDLSEWLPTALLSQLHQVRLCGNFGDPAVSRDTLEIAEFLRSANLNLSLVMNTNGSARDDRWWFRLGRLFRGPKDSVVFALDGLSDTHALYRRGTSFERILSHADAFMRGGGSATWAFLVFEHNEHQVEEARELAAKRGFNRFMVKRTKRFRGGSSTELLVPYPVADRRGQDLVALRPARSKEYRHENLEWSEDRAREIECATIQCRALDRRSLYIAASGLVLPCCWVGAALFPANSMNVGGSFLPTIGSVKDLDSLNLRRHSIEEILAHDFFKSRLMNAWDAPPGDPMRPRVCSRICGKDSQVFESQFLGEGT